MNRYKCMALIYPGKSMVVVLIFFIFLPGAIVSGQQFNELPPLLYNQLDPPVLNQESDVDLADGQFEKKSVSSAFFLSLLLPGLGEAYVGRTGYTKVFMSIEVVGWGLFVANEVQAASRREDYRNFAAQHAGVLQSGKTDQYWIDIGKYNNIFDFNEQRRRDRDVAAIYAENSENFWRWDSKANRLSYDGKRITTSEIEERRTFIIGGIILNHLISAINALRVARQHNRNIDEMGWRLDMDFDPTYGQLSLGLSKSF